MSFFGYNSIGFHFTSNTKNVDNFETKLFVTEHLHVQLIPGELDLQKTFFVPKYS